MPQVADGAPRKWRVPGQSGHIAAFALSGACGGIAGIVLSSRLDAGDGNFGASNLLDAVAATVVGGTSLMGGAGSVMGTLGGVLIISVIRNGLVLLDVQAFCNRWL